MLIDTHTHLYAAEFDADREEVLQSAISAGIEKIILPAIDSEFIDAMVLLSQKNSSHVHLMAGVHPTHVKENYLEEIAAAKKMAANYKIVAIGETGMDLYWDKTYIKEQQASLRLHIAWAIQTGLPLVIHCREAFNEIFEILEDYRNTDLHGVFHCFTGTFEQAEHCIDLNFKLGIGGVVTYKNGKIDQFLSEISLEHIVLETDAPYLAPVPFRGKRNQPLYLKNIAERVAEIYGITYEELAKKTTLNARELFKI